MCPGSRYWKRTLGCSPFTLDFAPMCLFPLLVLWYYFVVVVVVIPLSHEYDYMLSPLSPAESLNLVEVLGTLIQKVFVSERTQEKNTRVSAGFAGAVRIER